MKKVIQRKEEHTREVVNEEYFNSYRHVLPEILDEHTMRIWIPGVCRATYVDSSVDFYNSTKEFINAYKQALITNEQEIYLAKRRVYNE